jgi:hypothetical protein
VSTVGYSDDAESGRVVDVRSLTQQASSIMVWTRRALELEMNDAKKTIGRVLEVLSGSDAGVLVRRDIRRVGTIYQINPEAIELRADTEAEPWRCPKCSSVQRFKTLRICNRTRCRETLLQRKNLAQNYFRIEYERPLAEAVRIHAAEHSGMIGGSDRKQIEEEFRRGDGDINLIVCTPTMELGIDIGSLSTVYMRNVPPSPSNYAQRSGRAGRAGPSSLVTTFCGAGTMRGVHDQYFYCLPHKVIAGTIAPPRFLLDNEQLIRAHIHSLILETIEQRLPSDPQTIVQVDQAGHALFPDLRSALLREIEHYRPALLAAVRHAFATEMAKFSWFTEAFVARTIDRFVDDFDCAWHPWRRDYDHSHEEIQELNRRGLNHKLERVDQFRRSSLEDRIDRMRRGLRYDAERTHDACGGGGEGGRRHRGTAVPTAPYAS